MNLEDLEKRCKELSMQVEQSASQHHILMGIKMEAERMLQSIKMAGEKQAAEVEAGTATTAIPD